MLQGTYQSPGAKAAQERYLASLKKKPNFFQKIYERFIRKDPKPQESEKSFEKSLKKDIPDTAKWIIIAIGLIGGMAAAFFGFSKLATIANSNTAPLVQGIASLKGFFSAGVVKFAVRSAPMVFSDLAANWLGWIILIPLIWLLISNFKSETADRNEPKDFLAVKRGLIVCLAIYFFADAIALKAIQACQFFEQGCVLANNIQTWTTIVFRAIGITFLIGSGFAAASGGNWDASPISVSVFLGGVLIKLDWPGASLVGDIAIIVAILIHIYEIVRHKEDRSSALLASLFTIAASIIVGTLVFYGARSIVFLAPYRLAIGYVAIILVALGTSSTVQHRVGAILPGSFRENLQDVPGNIYFDMKIVVLMIAITYLIIG